MKVSGSLGVMSLLDVLQWIMNSRKTGRLDVERKDARRSVYVRDGHVVACFSDDPSMLLGQYLLCHGRIREDTLQEALHRQESSPHNLGRILVEMGALREDQLQITLASKAMETIHGLFDWKDASFEFLPDEQPCAGIIDVDLELEEVLLQGAHRMDQMEEIRGVLPSADVVLQRAEREPDDDMLASPMARAIYDAIDGKKTIEEIRFACHASEFLVFKFLFELHKQDLVSVEALAESAAGAPSAEHGLASAERMLERGDYYAAVEILEPLCEAHPNDETIKQRLSDAEARFVVAVYREGLHPLSVPRRTAELPEAESSELSPTARHLLGRVDGRQNIKSILMVVPLRPVQALMALKTLQGRGLIDVPPAADAGGTDSPAAAEWAPGVR